MGLALQTFINGLSVSCFYSLMAVGFTLVFGVMQVANYGHGEFYMLGAYAVWLTYTKAHLPYPVAAIVAFFAVGLLGLITERLFFRPLRGDILGGAMMSCAFIFILQVFAGQVWGMGPPKPVAPAYPGALNILGIATFPWQRIAIIPATALILGLLWMFLSRTRQGRAMRACASDSEAARLQGININRSGALALFWGSGLAGLGGALMAPVASVHPYMGHMPLIIALLVVIVGGPGNIKGTILAAFLLGFVYTIFTTWLDSTIANIAMVVLMVIILAIRPEGLLQHGKA